MWRDAFIGVTWHVHMCDRVGDHFWSSFWFSIKQHYLSPCVIESLIKNMRVISETSWHCNTLQHIARLCLWNDSSTTWTLYHLCVTWLIHMAHSHVWHDSFIRDMPHPYAWHVLHQSFYTVRTIYHLCLTWLIQVTHSHVWHDSFIRDMPHPYVWRALH